MLDRWHLKGFFLTPDSNKSQNGKLNRILIQNASSYYSRHVYKSFAAAFICAIIAVKMLWHVLRQTFTDLPSSAIWAAKRCSVLHCSEPVPTRHECQIASEVNFLLQSLIRSTSPCVIFKSANTVRALILFCTNLLCCHFKRRRLKASDSSEACRHSSSAGGVTHGVGVGEITPCDVM